ncbi:hypothetical protein HY639_04030 [Candidatus Woesearchaeota archaeon]|nr:hypothetical protein [Candidatus Woesearchaeota archaeon]
MKWIPYLGALCALTTNACAELQFQWAKPVQPAVKQDIEQRITRAALKYTDKRYAEYGTHNFVLAKEKYVVEVASCSRIGIYEAKTNTVRLDPQLVTRPHILEETAVHEFCHVYDRWVGQQLLKQANEGKDVSLEIVFDLFLHPEERANRKEQFFISETRKKSPVTGEKMQQWFTGVEYLEKETLKGNVKNLEAAWRLLLKKTP